MKYWFVTQDPKVLAYTEHGVWVHQRFRDSEHSGRGLKAHDRVAIYEVGQNEEGRSVRGAAKAVVALSMVEKRIRPGKPEGRFVKIAETVLVAKDQQGMPTGEVLKILEDKTVDKSLFGTYILKYAGRVSEIRRQQFRRFEAFFDNTDDQAYQSRIETAAPRKPPKNPKKPVYVDQGKRLEVATDERLARYCLERAEYKCAIDGDHVTFISASTGRNYVEAHHLVPLEFQPEFDRALDNQANIIALCPNCHRLLHHSSANEKETHLRMLFTPRRLADLSRMGIDIELEDAIGYYS